MLLTIRFSAREVNLAGKRLLCWRRNPKSNQLADDMNEIVVVLCMQTGYKNLGDLLVEFPQSKKLPNSSLVLNGLPYITTTFVPKLLRQERAGI